MKNSIKFYDQRRKLIAKGDAIVLIPKAKVVADNIGNDDVRIKAVQGKVVHSVVNKIEQTSYGLNGTGPTVKVTLADGTTFSFNGHTGSDSHKWYKLSS